MQVSINLKSANRKTGPIPVSTTEKESCPDHCPLNGSGCYAQLGPTNIHWSRLSRHESGIQWAEFCEVVRHDIRKGKLWRHNEAGDLPHNNGTINTELLSQLVSANDGKRGFTYTHHDAFNVYNLRAIRQANRDGFTVNLSANSLEQAVQYRQLFNMPTVSVVPPETWEQGNSVLVDGVSVSRCPAEYVDNMTCADCGVCQVTNRKAVIGFTAHGTSKKKVADLSRRIPLKTL